MRGRLLAGVLTVASVGGVTVAVAQDASPSLSDCVSVSGDVVGVEGDEIVLEVRVSCPTVPASTTSTTVPVTSSTSTSTTSPTTTAAPTTTTTTVPPSTTTSSTTTTTVAPSTTTTTSTVPPVAGTFTADFSTASDFFDRFDLYAGNYTQDDCFTTACRGESNGINPTSWHGDHDATVTETTACSAPTVSRTVGPTPHSQMFYWCAPSGPGSGHVMTSINTSQYSIIAFSPRQSFTGVRRVCVDVNRTDLGGGKWTNITLVPESKYLSHPNLNPRRVEDGEGPYRLDYVTPPFSDANGPGGFNLQDLSGVVSVRFFRGLIEINSGFSIVDSDNSYWNGSNDKAARFEHCLIDNGDGTLTAYRDGPNGRQSTTGRGAFPAGAVRVIFEDDTYDADKHDGTGTYTWHWDNVEIVAG